MVCKLKWSLYGLKQSGRNWFECLSSHPFELNFKASVHDPCLLTLTRSGHKCWIVIWVDDILYGSTHSHFPRSSMTIWVSGSTLAIAALLSRSWEFPSSGVTVRWQWINRGMCATYFTKTVWASARQLQDHSQTSWSWRKIRYQKTDQMSKSKGWDMTTEA